MWNTDAEVAPILPPSWYPPPLVGDLAAPPSEGWHILALPHLQDGLEMPVARRMEVREITKGEI